MMCDEMVLKSSMYGGEATPHNQSALLRQTFGHYFLHAAILIAPWISFLPLNASIRLFSLRVDAIFAIPGAALDK